MNTSITKLTPVVTSLLVLVLVGSAWQLYRIGIEEAEEDARSRMSVQLSAREKMFQDKLGELTKDILFLKRVPPIQGIIRSTSNNGIDPVDGSTLELWKTRLESIFTSYLESTGNAYQVRYIGLADDGLEIVRVEKSIAGVEVIRDKALQKKGSRDYFKEITTQNISGVYFSDITLNRENGQIELPINPTLRVGLPVRASDSSLFGFVIVNVSMAPFLEGLQSGLADEQTLYLVNQDMDFLVHPNDDLIFRFESGEPFKWSDQFSNPLDSDVSAIQDKQGSMFVASLVDFPLMQGYHSLKMVITHPYVEIVNKARSSLQRNMLGVFAALLIIFIYFLLFRRSLKQKTLLSNERARSSAILEGSQDSIVGFSNKGQITDWNTGAALMFGMSKEQVIGSNIFSMLLPQVGLDTAENHLLELSNGNYVEPFETTTKKNNGEEAIVSVSLSAARNDDGKIMGYSAIIRDVTKQKVIEKEIQNLNQSLETKIEQRTAELSTTNRFQAAILSNAASGIIASDSKGIITHFNPTAEKMLGYSADEVIGILNLEKLHLKKELASQAEELKDESGRDTAPNLHALLAKTDAGRTNVQDWTYVRKDGQALPVTLSISSLVDDQGEIEGYLVVATDISTQFDARREIEAVKDQMTNAAKVAQLGVWTWHVDTDQLIWNDRMYEIYGMEKHPEQELAFEDWANCLNPNDKEMVVQAFEDTLENDTPFEMVFKILTPTGEHKHVKVGAMVERDEHGRPKTALGINMDVTEQVNYERLLKDAKDSSDIANKTKSEFVANMSHEIRTPMNAIIGLLHLLDKTKLTPKQHDYVKKSDVAAKSLLRILNDILDFSKVEAGKLELDPHPFKVVDMIDNLTPILSANIGDKDIELIIDVDYQLPVFVNLDSLRLQQVLINLAGNAIKFTEKGHVKVQLQLEKSDQGEDWLCCRVEDTGIGIKDEYLETLFDDFTQAESSTVRDYGGTGLGLAISKKLIEMMGGDIAVDSTPGQGSIFTFRIPITEASDVDNFASKLDLRHLNVLVVDDHIEARQALASVVSSLGWSVQTAASGNEAVSKIEDNSEGYFDLVLMDYDMPEINGLETSEKIKELVGKSKASKILLVTAYGKEISLNDNQRAVIEGVLDKPLGPSELVNAAFRLFSSEPEKVAQAKSKTVRLDNTRILLVEDNEINRLVAREMLEAEGATISIAVDGLKGVERVTEDPEAFDLILMDIQMPGIDGYEATKRIRQIDKAEHVPIIAMTANVMPRDKAQALSAGMDAHLGKPIDIDEVVSTIRSCLQERAGSQAKSNHQTDKREQDLGSEPKTTTMAEEDSSVLNIKPALSRLGNNKLIFLKTAELFLRDTPKMLMEIPNTWPVETKPAAVAAHTLKSIAGTVGADRVAMFCQKIESDLKDGVEHSDYEKDVLALRAEFELARDGLSRVQAEFLGEKDSKEVVREVADLKERMELLEELLISSNMRACEVFESIEQDSDQSMLSSLEKLKGLISNLDFEGAATECRDVLSTRLTRNDSAAAAQR